MGGNTTYTYIGDPQKTYTRTAKITYWKKLDWFAKNRMYGNNFDANHYIIPEKRLELIKGAKIDIQDIGGETLADENCRKATDVVKMFMIKGANIVVRQQTKYDFSPKKMHDMLLKSNIPAN